MMHHEVYDYEVAGIRFSLKINVFRLPTPCFYFSLFVFDVSLTNIYLAIVAM